MVPAEPGDPALVKRPRPHGGPSTLAAEAGDPALVKRPRPHHNPSGPRGAPARVELPQRRQRASPSSKANMAHPAEILDTTDHAGSRDLADLRGLPADLKDTTSHVHTSCLDDQSKPGYRSWTNKNHLHRSPSENFRAKLRHVPQGTTTHDHTSRQHVHGTQVARKQPKTLDHQTAPPESSRSNGPEIPHPASPHPCSGAQ
jgi:hypothetical protein